MSSREDLLKIAETLEKLLKIQQSLSSTKSYKRSRSKAQYKALIKAIHHNKRMSAKAKREAIKKLKHEMRGLKK